MSYSLGVERIAIERDRQMDKEGWTAEHDDKHISGELIDAAVSYLGECVHAQPPGQVPDIWPWETEWWKPSEDPIRNLERAGALIAAEIDRRTRERKP